MMLSLQLVYNFQQTLDIIHMFTATIYEGAQVTASRLSLYSTMQLIQYSMVNDFKLSRSIEQANIHTDHNLVWTHFTRIGGCIGYCIFECSLQADLAFILHCSHHETHYS